MRFKNNSKKAKIAPTGNRGKNYKHSETAQSTAKHTVLILRIAGEFEKKYHCDDVFLFLESIEMSVNFLIHSQK